MFICLNVLKTAQFCLAHAVLSWKGFNGARSRDSVAMKTKMPKCNQVQMSFLNTSYEINLIIIAISIIIRGKLLICWQLYLGICKIRVKLQNFYL